MGHILNMYKDFVACGLRIYLHNNKISIIVRYKYNIVSLSYASFIDCVADIQ